MPPEIENTNVDNVQELMGELVKVDKEHKETVKENNATLKTMAGILKALTEKKLAEDPDTAEKIEKMNTEMGALTDKIKTLTAQAQAHKLYGTEKNLHDTIFENQPFLEKTPGMKNFAKSIYRDPLADKYTKAYHNFIKGAINPMVANQKFMQELEELKSTDDASEDSFVKKSLNTIVGSQGGYFVPAEISLDIQKQLFETDPLRQVATVMTVGTDTWKFPIRTRLPESFWEGTELNVNEDTSTQAYQTGQIEVNTLQAQPEISLDQLEDSAINIESELRQDLMETFMLAENAAFINGNGIKQPRGLANYAQDSALTPGVEKPLQIEHLTMSKADYDTSAGKLADSLLDLEAAVLSPYKMKAHYLISRQMKSVIRQIKDKNGNYLFSLNSGWGSFQGLPQIRDGMHGRINGYPVLECDSLPGSVSSDAGQNFPIYFGNFSKYVILDRIGLSMIIDQVTKKGFVKYFFRKRVGAGLKLAQSIKVLKVEA